MAGTIDQTGTDIINDLTNSSNAEARAAGQTLSTLASSAPTLNQFTQGRIADLLNLVLSGPQRTQNANSNGVSALLGGMFAVTETAVFVNPL